MGMVIKPVMRTYLSLMLKRGAKGEGVDIIGKIGTTVNQLARICITRF